MNPLTKIDVRYDYYPKVYTYKKKDNRWYWKYKLPGGAWFYCPTKTNEQESRRNASKKAADLAKGLFTRKEVLKMQSSKGILTLEGGLEMMLEEIHLQHSSHYYSALKFGLTADFRYFKDVLSVFQVHKVSEGDVIKFRNYLLKLVKERRITQRTASNRLNDMRRYFKWLRRRKILFIDPCLEVEPIKVNRENQARNVAATPEFLSKIMDADYEHRYGFPIKELVFFLFATGARLREALYLEVEDIDLEKGEWLVTSKPNCPTPFGIGWAPKNFKTRRVPLIPAVVNFLRPLVERAQKNRVVGYIPLSNEVSQKGLKVVRQAQKKNSFSKTAVEAKFIFTMKDRTLSSGGQLTYRRIDEITHSWGALCAAAGLVTPRKYKVPGQNRYKGGERVRFSAAPYTRHDLRRGFNVEATKMGIGMKERCAILGHNPEVNTVHYKGGEGLDLTALAKKIQGVKGLNRKC